MGKLIKGRFAPKKKAPRAKIKAKVKGAPFYPPATKPVGNKGDRRKVQEYVTITHAAVKDQGPCSGAWRRFTRTFPYREFGVRGVPITYENVLRGMIAGLPVRWVLYRFAGESVPDQYAQDCYGPLVKRSVEGWARVAAELLVKYARTEKTKRFYVRGKVQSLKGVKLEPAPSPLGYSQQSLVA